LASFCTYFNLDQCRSCSWITLDYATQLERKDQLVRDALVVFPSVIALEAPAGSALTGFRNRAKMAVTGTSEAPVIGLTGGEDDLDQGQELLACPIHDPRLNELMSTLPEFIRAGNLVPYRISERKGELKGLIAFHSPGTDQLYVRFVLRSKECVSRLRALVPALQSRIPGLVCVTANIQPVPHAILEGPEEIVLTERAFIDHQLGPFRLRLAPQAFVQTNVAVATALYETAARWIAEARAGKVLDLFCGQGAFSFFAAAGAAEIRGVELNAEAVRTAQATARELGLAHLSFKSADAATIDAEIAAFEPDLILANPPRRGLAGALPLIQRHRPAHFIYSSCAIQTLASDLRGLSEDYRPRRARLFDMFPHTAHFETLVWLERLQRS
jgi:23S rRNA (uracil747-C5)-methyltransferase